MKKIIVGLVLAAVAAALTGCNIDASKYPFVKIERDTKYSNDIVIPIGQGFSFTRQVYTICDSCMNRIIHYVRKHKEVECDEKE